MKIELSIVVLTKNSMGTIQNLMAALMAQEFSLSREYIFMDNGSKDETVDYLQTLPLNPKTIIHVPEGEFSHSRTRMQAAEAAQGEMVAFFTDDIRPIGKDFLLQLTSPIREGLAPAVYGAWQIDETLHDPVDAYLHNSWYASHPEISKPINAYCWDHFAPLVRRKLSNFDNCSSCIRRDILLETRFPDVPYGEDMLFAKTLILNGHSVALAKNARFFHWHKVRFTYMLKRMCIDSHLGIREFGIYYVSRMLGVIKAVLIRALQRSYIAFFKVRMPLHKKIYWSFYNFKNLSADFIGKYIGTLSPERARGKLSFLKRYLLRKKNRILDAIEKKSIHRY